MRQADRMAVGIEHPDFHPGIRPLDFQFVPNRIGIESDARCPSRLVADIGLDMKPLAHILGGFMVLVPGLGSGDFHLALGYADHLALPVFLTNDRHFLVARSVADCQARRSRCV